MKRALATITAMSLIAVPMYAANAAQTKTTTKASTSVAKQAKAEGESTKTEAKEIRQHAAATHKYGTYRRCAPSHMASSHHTAAMHKTAKSAAKKG